MPFNPSYRPQDEQNRLQPQDQQEPLAPAPAQAQPGVDQWGNQAGSSQAGIDSFWNAVTNQGQTQFDPSQLSQWGVTQLSPDKYQLNSTGQTVDTVRDIGGANAPSWTISGGQTGQNGQAAAGGGGGGGGQGSSSASASFSGAGGGANVDPELRAALLRLMSRSEPGPIDVNADPNLSPQARAYSDARQRGAQRERASLAERSAFGGLNSGGAGSGSFTSGVADIGERAGQDIAGQQAGLVGQEVAARRQDLLNSLQLANAIGARDQSASIQTQLANLDNQYRYSALNQNQSQFNDQYGLNKAQLGANLNRDAYLSLLGGGQ